MSSLLPGRIRQVEVSSITGTIARLLTEACYELSIDLAQAFARAARQEASEPGREVFRQLLENARLAAVDRVPLCQDTGLAVVFLEIGQDVHLVGGDLEQAVNEGVRQASEEGYLRKSTVDDPAGERRNRGDNTPAMLHTRVVPGDKVRLTVAPKGGGAENMSAVAMLKPSDGRPGVVDFVVRTVEKAGPNACPPMIVGVGVGGTFEKAATLAKMALLRDVGSTNPVRRLQELEDEVESRCNDLGIGPQGLGGSITVLDVFVEELPAHIASLPVAVNIQCHSARHREAVL